MKEDEVDFRWKDPRKMTIQELKKDWFNHRRQTFWQKIKSTIRKMMEE